MISQTSQANNAVQTSQTNQASHAGQMGQPGSVRQISTGSQASQPVQVQAPIAHPANYSVAITATQFDAPGDDCKNANGEWVQITNLGKEAVDMAGWILDSLDSSGSWVYTFPKFSLASGASVKVFTGKGVDSLSELYIGMGLPVWNNKGDMATLKDAAGRIVSQRSE